MNEELWRIMRKYYDTGKTLADFIAMYGERRKVREYAREYFDCRDKYRGGHIITSSGKYRVIRD